MARRRYISTEISIDKEVNKLALQFGDFAALLYTWMIPHAEDDRTITADAYELLNKVVPGRRDKTEEDVQAAINGMLEHKLITLSKDGKLLKFKARSFYKYQSYIPERKRYEEGEESNTQIDDLPIEEEELKKSTGKVFQFYQKNIGVISPFQAETLIQYLDEGMEPEMIIAVLKDSIGKSTPWAWIKAVLASNGKKNIKTLVQYEADKVERTNKNKAKGGNKPTRSDAIQQAYDELKMEENNDTSI